MPVPTIELTGEGATGLLVSEPQKRAVAQLPASVKLGRKAPKSRPQCLSLASYLKTSGAPVPPAVDYYTKAAASIARMYLNDRYGCCVISGKAHNLGVWSGNDADSGPLVLATDNEIQSQYFGICGPGDNGCYISEVLDVMRTSGFQAGGKRYKIKGYVSVDWRSKELVQTAIAMFGALSIGFNLPGSWTNSKIWDVSNAGGFVGGHDVSPIGYGARVLDTNSDGVVVSSWGRLYLFTWAAFTSTRYLDECYVMVPEDLWFGLDKKSPLGMDVEALLRDMAKLDAGDIPPIPDPPPIVVPPVVPPPPPLPATLHGTADLPQQTIPAQTVSFQTGPFGRRESVTIPAQVLPARKLPVTVSTAQGVLFRAPDQFDSTDDWAAGRVSGPGIDWRKVWELVRAFGAEALPIILEGLRQGKSWREIVAELVTRLWAQR